MEFIVKTTSAELERARNWWLDLSTAWKWAYNEAVFGQGPTLAPPSDDLLMFLLIQVDTLRFAGPTAPQPNVSHPLEDLSGLIPLYHLKYLSFTHMQITDIRLLKRHGQLEHLFLYNNHLTTIDGIEGMSQLKELYLQENQLKSLTPLRYLHNLEKLYVSNNLLESLEGIHAKHARQLKKLYVFPNSNLPDRSIIRVQNELGILCRQG